MCIMSCTFIKLHYTWMHTLSANSILYPLDNSHVAFLASKVSKNCSLSFFAFNTCTTLDIADLYLFSGKLENLC